MIDPPKLQVRRERSTGSAIRRAQRLFGRENYVPVRTGRRRGLLGETRAYPEQPPTWEGTLPEWAIYWAHGELRLKEGDDFDYIPRLALATGVTKGAQVDFLEHDLNIAINIQGLFWHYGFSAAKRADDLEQRVLIEASGTQYIAIDEDHALDDPIYYLREAREGRDHSRMMAGVS